MLLFQNTCDDYAEVMLSTIVQIGSITSACDLRAARAPAWSSLRPETARAFAAAAAAPTPPCGWTRGAVKKRLRFGGRRCGRGVCIELGGQVPMATGGGSALAVQVAAAATTARACASGFNKPDCAR